MSYLSSSSAMGLQIPAASKSNSSRGQGNDRGRQWQRVELVEGSNQSVEPARAVADQRSGNLIFNGGGNGIRCP
ncbi:hypothetical protein ACLOJK_006459, partial [Asimina triloba]